MDTTAAAAKAHVTTATIRSWCRRNVVAAVKTAGTWAIDEASLNRRITLGHHDHAAEIRITRAWAGRTAVLGPAAVLAAAFRSGTTVAITAGPFSGERIHLGYTGAYGYSKPKGLDQANPDGTAVYLVDIARLDSAPRLAGHLDDSWSDAAADLRQADADESSYSNPRYV